MLPDSPFRRGYFGRVVSAGLTVAGRPAIWAVLTGRGRPSRRRRATVRSPASGATVVDIVSFGQLPNDAAAALVTRSVPALAAAGFGLHLDDLCASLSSGIAAPQALAALLARHGPEGPPYRTPRNASLLLPSPPAAWLGVTTEPEHSRVAALRLAPGRFQCLPALSGATGSVAPISEDVASELVDVDLPSTAAPDLASDAYDLFDDDLIVCAVAAVWEPTAPAWKVAIRNLPAV